MDTDNILASWNFNIYKLSGGRMKKLTNYTLIALTSLLFSCGPDGGGGVQPECKQIPGGKYRGGIFHLNESEFIRTLYPHAIIDASSYRTATQIFEGLLKRDQEDLSLKNGLAEEWSMDSTRTVYTFKIRKGVKFHDNACFEGGKGRELTAHDVKWCFTRLCTYDQNNMNVGFSTIFQDVLKGANEYYEASKEKTPDFDVEGIKVINDYEIQLHLVKPNSVFKHHLAGPYGMIFAKEAFKKYGLDSRVNPVGTGPFMVKDPEKDIAEGIKIILKRNPNYWGKDEVGNQLPLLDALEITFISLKRTEMTEFTLKNLDMIYKIPSDNIIAILKGEDEPYQLQREPEMATHMLAFLNTDPIFNDINLRKAFSFAIDRTRILEFVFDGEGDAPGFNGVTPNTFQNYNTDNIDGYELNADSALYYLDKTPYGRQGQKEFPTLQLYLNPDGQRNMEVAEEVQNQLKRTLGIEIKIEPIPRAQLGERMVSGKLQFFRLGWFADYPHPQAFLYLFYGKNVPTDPEAMSYPNVIRYKNPEFDKLYEAGMDAATDEEAYKYFMEAEQLLMKDCPIITLWYDEGYRLLQPYVKDFPSNPMQYRDFSKVYLECTEVLSGAEEGK